MLSYLKTILFLILIPQFIISQIDTTFRLSFYPLDIGNKWQYQTIGTFLGDTIDVVYGTKEIIGDTIMPNGKKYFSILYDTTYGHKLFQRIDTLSLKVFQYSTSDLYPNCEDSEYDIFDLSIVDSTNWENCRNANFDINTSQNQLSVGNININAIQTVYYGYYLAYNRTLSSGFGLSYSLYSELGYTSTTYLNAALINGIQYGEFLMIQKERLITPIHFSLKYNYPNPFNFSTIIEFDVYSKSKYTLNIYDITGRTIAVLLNKSLDRGNYKIKWDTSVNKSGIYFYSLESDNINQTKKCILQYRNFNVSCQ